jgi:hypothetical protein
MVNPNPTEAFGLLYDEMNTFLAQYGTDDALGNGDFDICPDNYNNRDFYVLVNNISVVHPSWIGGIQAILKKIGGDWLVHIRLGIPATGDRAEIDCPGIEITAHGATELWDRSKLTRLFGRLFHFSNEQAC